MGSNPNLLDGIGRSPLSNAIYANSLEIVTLLIENGAMVDALDGNGFSPFHNAVESNKIKIIRNFLQNGADFKAKNVDGDVALELALKTKQQNSLKMLLHY